jgi:CO dehydrogenase/acetyl-CoA synthase alpha subunit
MSNRAQRRLFMQSLSQSDHSVADLIELKELNRKQLSEAIREAAPEALDAAAQRMKEVMRRPKGLKQRRKRIAPPAFSIGD